MEQPTTTPLTELVAPRHWRCIDLISDLHLQSADMVTFDGFRSLLQSAPDKRADALFILGDLFEVWVGDDVLEVPPKETTAGDPERRFLRDCAALLFAYSQHTPVYFMPGNRDFLMGTAGLARCGMQALADPTVLSFGGQRYLLSHGDALCLEDKDYMHFRALVRQPAWKSEFLSRPLDQRESIARELRHQSESRKSALAHDTAQWADVEAEAACTALRENNCITLIHGHTHRPASHDLGNGLQRIVLSDWDLAAQPPRAEVLRIDSAGLHRRPLPQSTAP